MIKLGKLYINYQVDQNLRSFRYSKLSFKKRAVIVFLYQFFFNYKYFTMILIFTQLYL